MEEGQGTLNLTTCSKMKPVVNTKNIHVYVENGLVKYARLETLST